MADEPRSLRERINADPTVLAASRLMQIFGIPVACWLFLQVWDGVNSLRAQLSLIGRDLARIETHAADTDRRVDKLERSREPRL